MRIQVRPGMEALELSWLLSTSDISSLLRWGASECLFQKDSSKKGYGCSIVGRVFAWPAKALRVNPLEDRNRRIPSSRSSLSTPGIWDQPGIHEALLCFVFWSPPTEIRRRTFCSRNMKEDCSMMQTCPLFTATPPYSKSITLNGKSQIGRTYVEGFCFLWGSSARSPAEIEPRVPVYREWDWRESRQQESSGETAVSQLGCWLLKWMHLPKLICEGA